MKTRLAALLVTATLVISSAGCQQGGGCSGLLLTCREARLVGSLPDPSSLARLRFGSSGPAVEALQQALNGQGYSSVSVDGVMGPQTTMTYIQWQQAWDGGAADGIVTAAAADALGFDLVQ